MDTNLQEQDKIKLDGIVQKMIANKESDSNIRLVVNDFKQKYAKSTAIPSTEIKPVPTIADSVASVVNQFGQNVIQPALNIGKSVISSEIGVGSTIGQGQALKTNDFNQSQVAKQALDDIIFKTQQQITQNKKEGKDTTQLESILKDVQKRTQGIADVANIAPATQKSNTQALGEVAGVGLDALTAGIGGVTSAPVKATLGETLKRVGIDVGKNLALGYGYDVASSLQNDTPDFTPGFATAVGALGPVLSEGLTQIGKILPVGMVKAVLPKLKEGDTLEHALNSSTGLTTTQMINNSKKALTNYDTQINTILRHPENANTFVPGSYVTQKLLTETPGYEYTAKEIFSKLKTQLPSQAKTLSSLEKGSIDLVTANKLRQELDKISYKSIIDSPEIKASKELAGKFGNILREFVQNTAEETKPIFSKYSKEIRMYQALNVAKDKLGLKPTLKDYLAIGTGFAHSGVEGSIAALLAERALTNPAINLNTAKVIQKVAPKAAQATAITSKVAPKAISTLKTKGNENTNKNTR